jgi:subfamily B ATP-binding cassette protein MsbA
VKKFLLKRLFGHFSFFYRYLGISVVLSLVATMLVAVLDGIGLTMFLPLLQVAGGGDVDAAAGEEMGDMAIVLEGLQGLGIPMTLVNILILMLIFFALKGVAKFFVGYYNAVLRQRFANRLRLQNMQLLANYDYRAFAMADSGEIQNTLSGEVERLNNSFRYYFATLQFLIMTMVYVVGAYVANPKFAFIVAVGGAVSNLAFSRIYRITKEASRQITLTTHQFQGFLIQSVSSFKFLKATNLIRDYKKRVDTAVVEVEKQQRRVGVMTAISTAMREPLIVFIVVIAIYIQVNVFEQSLGLIILSLLFLYRGLTSLTTMQNYYNSFLSTIGSIENMRSFVSKLEKQQEPNGSIKKEGLESEIQVNNLVYHYDDHPVLQGVSFRIKKYETIGVVGESGTGKTTLANIICGLLLPEPGQLFVDGVDMTDIDLDSYRRKVGYVTQEAQVFSDDVFNNISFWDERTPETEARVWSALRLAHADGFTRKLPKGLDTQIGINGVNLSGGQRQRLSIARELYRKVDIMVLDEATSSLDSQSEQSIQENIDSLSGSYTMIVIAHRLSTIRNADKIIYLKPGGKYEIGSFEDLTERSATFQKMVDLQSMA